MARVLSTAKALVGIVLAWAMRLALWTGLTGFLTLTGALLLMLIKDWTPSSLFTSFLFWPVLALGALLAIPVTAFPVGRAFLYSALGWAIVYNLALLSA